jgi:hypothetical protein
LPTAAQADITLSGSVQAEYITAGKSLDIDADLDIKATEVLANGMIASASIDVDDAGSKSGNTGELGLEGDFGKLTVGSDVDMDGAFQSGILVGNTVYELYEDTSDSAATANAIHYSGSWANIKVQAQVNSSTEANPSNTQNAGTAANQVAATYESHGVAIGLATVNSDMKSATSSIGKTIKESSVSSVTYSFGDLSAGFGDLSVGYAKDSSANDPVMMASYKTTLAGVAVTASFYDNGENNEVVGNRSTSTHGSASYTMDNLTVDVAYDSDKGASASQGVSAGDESTTVTATYVAGDMTAKVGTKFDGSTDVSVALDLGNADLSLERDESKNETKAKYSVAF